MTWLDGEMTLRWPWLVALLVVGVVALLVLWVRHWQRRVPVGSGYVAHAARISALPRYQTLVRNRIRFGTLASIAVLIALAGSIILSGRVVQATALDRDVNARDVMLCLDASGSMAEYNVAVLREMQEIVRGLDGERVGLAIWSKATITVFPLTDDYAFADQRLRDAELAFDGLAGYFTSDEDWAEYQRFIAGTQRPDGNDTIVSQIGDGLASCVQRFGDLSADRGRAVILASDNEPYGEGVFTLAEASEYAIRNDVVVHGIGTEGVEDRGSELVEFSDAVTNTGGIFGNLDGGTSAAALVEQINDLEAARLEEPPVVQTLDRPIFGTVLTGAGLLGLALVWWAQSRANKVAREGR